MAAHRDQDVYRWCVARRVALEALRPGSAQAGVTITRRGRVETITVSAARGGAAAVRAIATPRSKVRV